MPPSATPPHSEGKASKGAKRVGGADGSNGIHKRAKSLPDLALSTQALKKAAKAAQQHGVCRACASLSHSAHTCGVRGYTGNEALAVVGNPPARSKAIPVPLPSVLPFVKSKGAAGVREGKQVAALAAQALASAKTPLAKAKSPTVSRKESSPASTGKSTSSSKSATASASKSTASSASKSAASSASAAAAVSDQVKLDKGKAAGRPKKREQCEICRKTFASESQLKFHLQVCLFPWYPPSPLPRFAP